MSKLLRTEIQPSWRHGMIFRYHWYLIDEDGQLLNEGTEKSYTLAEQAAESARAQLQEPST